MLDVFTTQELSSKLYPVQIECICSFNDSLLLGTKRGALFLYRIDEDNIHLHRQYNYITEFKAILNQIAVFRHHEQLILLSDSHITLHNIAQLHDVHTSYIDRILDTGTELISRVTLFAVHQTPEYTVADKQPSAQLAVVVSGEIILYHWLAKGIPTKIKVLRIQNNIPKAMIYHGDYLYLSMKEMCCQIDIRTSKIKNYYSTGPKQESAMLSVDADTMVFCKDERSILVTDDHQTLSISKWIDCPTALLHYEPYILAVINKGLEVKTKQLDSSIQVIELPSVKFVAQDKHTFVASANCVWKIKLNDLVKQDSDFSIQDHRPRRSKSSATVGDCRSPAALPGSGQSEHLSSASHTFSRPIPGQPIPYRSHTSTEPSQSAVNDSQSQNSDLTSSSASSNNSAFGKLLKQKFVSLWRSQPPKLDHPLAGPPTSHVSEETSTEQNCAVQSRADRKNMICGELFDCKIATHRCPMPCTPKHAHRKCLTIVPFKFMDCDHQTYKECHVDEKTMVCNVNVNKMMSCGHNIIVECYNNKHTLAYCKEICNEVYSCCKHRCQIPCTPNHSHRKCTTIVPFKFRDCDHQTYKECHVDENTMLCKVNLHLQFQSCGHKIIAECNKNDERLLCKEICKEVYNCEHRHNCQAVCSKRHGHLSSDCPVLIDFIIPACRHTAPFKKACGDPVPLDVKCQEVVRRSVSDQCKHMQKRFCHDAKQKCHHACEKLRKDCGHPCTRECYQTCIDIECGFCSEQFSQVFICPQRRNLAALLTCDDWLYGTISGAVKSTSPHIFVRPASILPQKFMPNKDVLVRISAINGAENLMPLKERDKLEFQLISNPRKIDVTAKGIKPSAYKANVLSFCANRTLSEVNSFFQATTVKVKDESSRIGTLDDIMTNDALWLYLFDIKPRDEQHGSYQKYISRLLDFVFFLNDYTARFVNRRTEWFALIVDRNLFDKGDEVELKALKMKFIESSLSSDPTNLQALLPMLKGLIETGQKESHFMYQTLLKIAQVTDLSDWHELKQIPATEELFGDPLDKVKYLKPVVLKSAYSDHDHYLDVYYRLLRTECFSAIQKGITDFKKEKLDERDMSVYYNVSFRAIDMQRSKIMISLQFELKSPVRDWKKSKNLMFGNLLCLSTNKEFTDPIWVTVGDRDPDCLTKSRIIGVEMIAFDEDFDIAKSILSLMKNSGRMLMVESPTYFQSFRYILSSLKHSGIKDFCLAKEIVYGECTVDPYVVNYDDSVVVNALAKIQPQLESRQWEAFNHALKTSLAIIQGPPGTGKTYVGGKIVEYFLETELNEHRPILLLTYKNHALDEFLKHCLEFCDTEYLTRMGGQSKEPDLEQCLVREKLKSSAIRKAPTGDLIREIEELFEELESQISILDSKGFINFKTFLQQITEEQFVGFLVESLGQNVARQKARNSFVSLTLLNYYNSHDHHLQYNALLRLVCDRNYIPQDLDVNVMAQIVKKLESGYNRWIPDKKLLYNLTQLQHKGSWFFNKSEENKQNNAEDAPVDNVAPVDNIDEVDEDYINELYSSRASAFDDDFQYNLRRNVQFGNKTDSGTTDERTFSLSDFPVDCNVDNSLLNKKDIINMTNIEKYTFLFTLLQTNYQEMSDKINSILGQIDIKHKKKQFIDESNKIKVLKTQKIVGATIVGASVQLSLIKKLQPKIVIVEEAAEILEACLVGVLTESVEKLILIGDHKQLKPQLDTFNLRKEYDFHISMMERLILMGFPFKSLLKQGRMRPEFSSMLKDIYPELDNFPGLCKKNIPIKCLPNTMYFWSHKFPEKKERSVYNLKEANMVVALALYFLSSGVNEEDITILCAYGGQVQMVRKIYQDLNPRAADKKMLINIRTIDEYQGDENKFLIISLTRSNDAGNIGFMKEEERRCVAQSRAKCGMYFVGNADLYRKSPTWKGIINSMETKNLVSSSLDICCPKHPSNVYKVVQSTPKLQKKQNKDRNQLMYYVDEANNWCNQICKELFDCKIEAHRCLIMCTPAHSHGYCKAMVPYSFTDCDHDTFKKCHVDGKSIKCKVNIKNILPCGHEKSAECNEWIQRASNNEKMMCEELCEQFYNCPLRHKCESKCGNLHEHYSGDCPIHIEFRIPNCGHTAHFKKKCGGSVPTNVKCKTVIEYTSALCQHTQRRACHEEEKCKHPCRILRKNCGHPCTKKCFQACLSDECELCKVQYGEALTAAKDFAKKQLELCLNRHPQTGNLTLTMNVVPATSPEYNNVSDTCRMFFNLYATCCTTEIIAVNKIDAPSDTIKFWEKATVCNGVVKEELYKLLKGTITEEDELKSKLKRGKTLEFCKYASKTSTKENGRYTLVIADVLLGEMINDTDPDVKGQMNVTTLATLKKDSVQCIRDNGPSGYWVFDKNQVNLKYIVHFFLKRTTVSSQNPVLDRLKDGLTVIDLATFDFRDQSNPMCDYITKALSLYKGDCLKRQSYIRTAGKLKDVKQVGLVINSAASAAYDERLQLSKGANTKYTEIFAYHATNAANVDSIVKNNLNPGIKMVNGRLYGDGSYFSEHPQKSHAYGDVMFIFRLILIEGQYTKVQPDRKGFCVEIILKDASLFKPVYLLHF